MAPNAPVFGGQPQQLGALDCFGSELSGSAQDGAQSNNDNFMAVSSATFGATPPQATAKCAEFEEYTTNSPATVDEFSALISLQSANGSFLGGPAISELLPGAGDMEAIFNACAPAEDRTVWITALAIKVQRIFIGFKSNENEYLSFKSRF